MTTTTCLVGTSRDGGVVSADVSYLHSVSPSDSNFRPNGPELQGVKALQFALESSQVELIAARQQVAVLTETVSHLARRAVDREREFTNPQRFAIPDVSRKTTIDEVSTGAAQCSLWWGADFCLFEGLDPDATAHVEQLLATRIRLRKGEVLYRAGGRFNALYAIRTGSCMTSMLAKDGREQVVGFYMPGEIIGLDGINTDIHDCEAMALEDTEACQLPFDEIESLAHRNVRFQRNLHRLLTHRYARARTLMLLLGTMTADQRLAVFLLDLSHRYHTRGYSSFEFRLRMTRGEIGSYLGLTLETVSRLFSRLQREGLIQIEGRAVKLLDRIALAQIVDGGL